MTDYLFDGARADEADRLRLLGTLYDAHSLRMLSSSGLGASSDMLEIGPGAGTLVAGVVLEADLVQVTLCDIGFGNLDPAVARESRVRLVAADAARLPLADQSFDLVHCRMVISHLSSGLSSLTEMLRVVRPGGHLIVEEIDRAAGRIFHGGLGFAKVRSAISQLLGASTYNQYLGSDLIAHAKRVPGTELVDVSRLPVLSCRPDDPIREIHALTLARFAPDLLASQLVDRADLERARADLATGELVFESSALVSVSLRRSARR